MKEKLGLIAGQGRFPLIVARAAREQGILVVAVAHQGQSLPELEKEVDEIHWVKVGQLGKLIQVLKSREVREAVMAGGIAKGVMYRDLAPDMRGLAMMAQLQSRNDDVILRAVAAELEKEGITVRESTRYISSLLAPKGCLTRRPPTERELDDILFGWETAKEMGRLDIGQTIVIKDKAVLAVEAIEGTDAAIRRGASFAGPGAVVVKVSKPKQDTRFDLPVVGLQTVRVLAETQVSALAVEAERTIIFDREPMVTLADQVGLAIVAR